MYTHGIHDMHITHSTGKLLIKKIQIQKTRQNYKKKTNFHKENLYNKGLKYNAKRIALSTTVSQWTKIVLKQ